MLPSSKRPKVIEEERAVRLQELQKERQPPLKLRFSKEDIFKKTIKEWYEHLAEHKKRRLTPLKLKRKAVNVCYGLKLEYDNIKSNWVQEMSDEQGLQFFRRKEKKQHEVYDVTKTMTEQPATVTVTSSGRKVKARRLIQMSSGPSLSFTQVTQATSTAPPTPVAKDDSNSNMSSGSAEDKKKEKKKKLLDLTGLPPPAPWLRAYCEGTMLPRVLTAYSTETNNMLFYDYNPKLQDSSGKEVKLEPRPRIEEDLDWFRNVCSSDTES